MKAAHSYETMVNIYQTTYILEDNTLYSHCSENFKSHIKFVVNYKWHSQTIKEAYEDMSVKWPAMRKWFCPVFPKCFLYEVLQCE
jgi:hypothetical protein